MKLDSANQASQTLFDSLIEQVDIAHEKKVLLEFNQFNARFGQNQVLKSINMQFNKNQINCIVGPSGSGKSTLLRCINRVNDDVSSFIRQGDILYQGQSIHAEKNVTELRTRIGLVFQKPCVFPKSIADNVLFGLQFEKKLTKQQQNNIIEENLIAVALWDEVKNRLQQPALSLSIGQQQRLCIARTLAVRPEVLLLDEPTSSLDPGSARAIENLMLQLKDRYSIIFVTHNIMQAKRIADRLIFMCAGQLIEQGEKQQLFTNPNKKQTWDYLNNEYCKC